MSMPVQAIFSPDSIPAGFDATAQGVFYTEAEHPKQLTTVKAWVCAVLRTIQGNHWSIQVAWVDLDGNTKSAILTSASLSKQGNAFEDLSQDGLFLLPGAASLFARYLMLAAALPAMPRVRTHRKLGFFTLVNEEASDTLGFMLPYASLHPKPLENPTAAEISQTESICFHPLSQSKAFDAYSPAGSLEHWQSTMAQLAGNDLIVFALCVGFASPFLAHAGLDNVIFHLFGNSSTGKTTALQAGVSVWGRGSDPQISGPTRSLIERWNSTANAMEPMAATHSGMLLAIDELGSSGDSMVSVYNATSGRGKSRMSETGSMQSQHEWTLCILSSGEFSMQEKIEETTKRKAKTGEIIRANDIPVAELAHDHTLGQDEERTLIDQLKRMSGEAYGTAGPAFVQAIIDHFRTETNLRAWLKEAIDDYHRQMVEEAEKSGKRLGPAHVRALRRFAFVMTVGQLAAEYEILPFSIEVVIRAVSAVSNAWLTGLPPLSEGERALDAIRNYVVRHTSQILNYDAWKAAQYPVNAIPRDMRAIQKRGLLLFTPDQFEQACNGMSAKEALKHLRDQGMLKREGQKTTYRVDIAELDIKRFPFHAIQIQRLLSGTQDLTIKEELLVLPADQEVNETEHDHEFFDESPDLSAPTLRQARRPAEHPIFENEMLEGNWPEEFTYVELEDM
jgi:putative DNA primase/helicase